jgi:hypothetical protein
MPAHSVTRNLFCLTGLFGLLLFTACSNGSSSSALPLDVDALSLPDHIELSNVDDATAPSIHSNEAGYDDPGTDYMNEEKHTWVDDTDALAMVNDILEVVNQSGYENFVNRGAYKALVTPVGDSDTSQTGATATATNSEELMEITCEVVRLSNSSPMTIKVWVIEDDGPGGVSMLIRGYFEVTEGESAQYPYGIMQAHFKGNALNSNGIEIPGDPVFTMAMSVSANSNGDVAVQVVDYGEEEAGNFTFEWDNRANIVANEDLTEGAAYVYSAETDWDTQQLEEETFYFVYNEDYFKYQEEGEVDVYVADKNDLAHRIFSYKLFEKDTGDKVTMNSGFPIRLEGGEYAYIGYWGTWVPYGADLEDGDIVTHAETGDIYTLVKIGGKLTKHTREQIVLSELTDVEVSVWDNGSDIIVAWDGVNTFEKLGTRDFDTGMIEYLQNPVPYVFANEWEGGWCQALAAFLPLGGLTPDNADIVYYHKEETVNPNTAQDLELYYWGFALDAPITQIVIDSSGVDEAAYWAGAPTEKAYYFDSNALILKEDDLLGDEVILGAGLDLSGTNYEWGYHMGPLTTDGTYTAGNCWDIYDEATYYYWGTGQDEWNQFSTVLDENNDYVAFDAPMRFNYTHDTNNDINGDATNDGKTYNIEYDGHHLCVPWYFDDTVGEWVPAFNLKDGTVLVDTGTSTEYVVKGVEEELIMAEVTDPGILTQLETDLPIDATINPPTLEYNAFLTGLVGPIPYGAELKVIKGELVD